MLPKWHIGMGLVFSFLFKIFFPETSLINLSLIFLSSFLIDFDHYMVAAINTKNISLFNALEYYRKKCLEWDKRIAKNIFEKGDFHVFHTVEFHILILILSFYFNPLLYVFIGMVFHSLCDLVYLMNKNILFHRQYFLISWILSNLECLKKK
jgi:hypothetical protein